ncbi:MAG TPA: sugar ABC transporter permease, partial [Acetobacteraceae bacterium]
MRRETVYAYLLLLPALLLLVAFTHWPTAATLIDSVFATPHGSRPAPFVGLDNYQDLADDPVFWQALRNNA